MKKTLISAVLAATFGLVAMQASASDGTITFNGTITDTTCTVTGGGAASGQGNITVKLPTVSTTSLAKDGQTAGDTAFSLILNCSGGSPAGKTAALWIETSQTPALDTATGALKNQAAGGASNVEVRMVNPANNQRIDLSINSAVTNGATVIAANNQPAATIVGTTATLNYLGQYLAKGGAATAGAVNTQLTYSMQYN
ncbi:major type 1 subunit fimbrin (pilin) [Dyella jiangningensis]|uniref:fimbrial protein n=1 Tax=Dyella sp. AtDHG13 TaxID=1938897 RepID=UPI00088D7935|nr:fimbrial protein [Dyella sp. AtDHG13]PXV61293.1 major type 1 subunit fimbrin (pilin) [Dyella sp. AtDHG13]SDJ95662.1 major type 1 subunit fimbrin (pilin) [Dyella jiangningensis]